MSGIYIKGMEMPTKCQECLLAKLSPTGESLICDGTLSRVSWDERPFDCPLVPVPPHGRLVDEDVQDAQIEALIERHLHGYTKSTWDFVCELRDILKRNHTIIPADKEGEA